MVLTLSIVLIVLAVLGIITQYVGYLGGEIIFSYIGGCVIGVNYITTDNEYETEEGLLERRQHILAISLAFVSVNYIWYSEEDFE